MSEKCLLAHFFSNMTLHQRDVRSLHIPQLLSLHLSPCSCSFQNVARTWRPVKMRSDKTQTRTHNRVRVEKSSCTATHASAGAH